MRRQYDVQIERTDSGKDVEIWLYIAEEYQV